jgi:predicted nucleic-acid-binding Zn-ribbon protein
MILDNEQTKKVIANFDKTWAGPKVCPVCKHEDWVIAERVYELREYHGKGVFETSGSVIPFIVISCTYCGNTRFFNAIIMDVMKPQEKGEAKND